MSDATQAASSPGSEPGSKVKRRRRWKRWIKILLILLVIAGVAFRVALEVLLPTVVRRVANLYDLDCTYDRISLSMFGGNAQVWNLVLRPKDGGDSIIKADYVHGMISVPKLLRGRLVAYRAEVDGVDMFVAREADGSIPLLERLMTLRGQTAGTTEASGRVNLEPPLRIDAIRLSQVTTTFRDRSVKPEFETTVRTTVRLSDVGVAGRPARVRLQVEADPVMDALLVEGELRSTPAAIDADVSVVMRGLHPKAAAGYLEPVGLKPVADSMAVRARAKLTARVIPETSDVTGTLDVSDAVVTVNGRTSASMKALVVDATRVNFSAIEIARVLVQSGRASAAREADGALSLLGLELAAPVSTGTTTRPSSTMPTTAPLQPPAPFRVAVKQVRLVDLTGTFADQVILPGGPELSIRLDDMTAADFVYDPADRNARVLLEGAATVPGIAQSVSWKGTVAPFAAKRSAALQISALGVRPDALRPYLDLVGVRSEIGHATFAADVELADSIAGSGRHVFDASVRNVQFKDGENNVLDLPSAAVTGLAIGPSAQTIRVEALDLVGPTAGIRLDRDGTLAGGGLRIVDANAALAAVLNPTPTTRPASGQVPMSDLVAAIPRVEFGRISWKDARINFADYTAQSDPVRLSGTAGIEASDLVLDLRRRHADNAAPGRFRAWVELPKAAGRMQVEGTIAAGSAGAAITANVAAERLTGEVIGHYLKPLGIEPTLRDGQLRLKAQAIMAVDDAGAASLNAVIRDASLADGGKELLGADGVTLAVVSTSKLLTVERLDLDRPRGAVRRNADGTLEAVGIRILHPASKGPRPASTQPTTQPATPASPMLPSAPFAAVVKQLRIRDGALALEDLTASPPLKTALRGSIDLKDASLTPSDGPATVEISGGIEGIVDRANVAGQIRFSPEAPAAKLTIRAEGIRPQPVAGYLPDGIAGTMKNGRFAATIDASLANHKDGGIAANADVRDLVLSEHGSDDLLARVGAFTLRATRVDPSGGVFAIEELTSKGVEADVALEPDGAIEGLGFRIGGPKPPAQPADQPVAAPSAASTQPAPDVGTLVAEARRHLPLLTLRRLDLAVDRLGLRGLTGGADVRPLNVARFRLYGDGPIQLGGPDAAQGPPVSLKIDGGIDPIVKEFAVAVRSTPLAPEVTVTAEVTARGINGRGLTDVFPELKNVIVGDPLTDGTFVARADATLNYARRGPRDVDLSRGFTATIGVKPVEFRGTPDGPVLAGVAELRAEGVNVQPRTGMVTVKSIEVTKPVARLVRDEQGLHAFGVVVPLEKRSPAATRPADETAPGAEPKAPVARRTIDATPPPDGELRLDRLLVSGIDLVFEDRTTAPATIVPLKTLDLEVRDVSNRMLWTGRPMQFDLLCTADRVPLPPRKGSSAGQEPEMRELFSQVTASGRIGLRRLDNGSAALTGWAKTSVSGFELLGVRGMAETFKVTIGDGIFDDTNDIRFKEDGTIETRNRIVVTNLSLSEPADGPMRKALALPVPMDVAIGAVTDADGSITMNLPVTIESWTVEPDQLMAPVIGAVGQVLVTATASAPIKAVEGVGGILGLGGNDGPAAPEPPVRIDFLPGLTTLEPAQARRLAALAARLKRDKDLEVQLRHEFTEADVDRIRFRANPKTADVQVTAARLRREKAVLLAGRAAAAAEARAAFGSGRREAADAGVQALRSVDRQLTAIDRSLDQLYDLLRPGADGQADRRTRAAGLGVARDRMDLVQEALAATGIPRATERVRRTNPQFEIAQQEANGDADGGGRVVVTLVPKKR